MHLLFFISSLPLQRIKFWRSFPTVIIECQCREGCVSQPSSQAGWPHGSPLAAASSEVSGIRAWQAIGSQQQHKHPGFDRLRCPATAVDTEQCRHSSLLCHLSRMRDQAVPRASLCRSSTGGKAALCGCQQTCYALKT